MTTKIVVLIYKIFFLFLKILDNIFKKEFSYIFKDIINEKSIEYIKIKNKKVFFFIPNSFTKYRLTNFFNKEPDTLNWINSFKKNSIFFDIGANNGNYSIYASLVNPNIKKIFAFEPSFLNTRVLSRNISLNNLSNKIRIIQLPLYDKKNKILKMNEKSIQEGGSFNSFGVSFNSKGRFNYNNAVKNSYSILGTSLDSLIGDKVLPIPNYIKIDVDGIEHLILIGAKKMLKNKCIKSVLIELYPTFKKQYNLCFKILKKNGFKLLSAHKYNYIFCR